MSDPTADLISGMLISQVILVRLLEERGVLSPGQYREALGDWLEKIPSERRGQTMYDPLRQLMKSFEAKTGGDHSKH